jgi:hypothetical protein
VPRVAAREALDGPDRVRQEIFYVVGVLLAYASDGPFDGAAVLPRTSSPIHGPLVGHALEDASPFLVQASVRSEGSILEIAARGRRAVVRDAAIRHDLHGHDGGRRGQVDKIDIPM